jgi:phosphopantetheine--protein transferase-like protein
MGGEMETRERLRAVVAEFFETTPDRVDDGFRLAGPRMQGSVARYAFDAALRHKLGITCRAASTSPTFGDLATAVCGTKPTEVGPAPISGPLREVSGAPLSSPSTRRLALEKGVDLRAVVPTGARGRVTHNDVHAASARATALPLAALAASAGAATISQVGMPAEMLMCGVDIEAVDNLPSDLDPWLSDFYVGCFTRAEIAYCLLQDQPAMHFAGRWCAKEALKKCDNSLMHEPMTNLEVVREASGQVFFLHHAGGVCRRLRCSVSIAHTPTMAAAVVTQLAVAVLPPPAVNGSPQVSDVRGTPHDAPVGDTSRPGAWAVLSQMLRARLRR